MCKGVVGVERQAKHVQLTNSFPWVEAELLCEAKCDQQAHVSERQLLKKAAPTQ